MSKRIFGYTLAAVIALNAVVVFPVRAQQQETNVHGQLTINTDTGKVTGSVGAGYSQTNGNTTTNVSLDTNGKQVTVSGSQNNNSSGHH